MAWFILCGLTLKSSVWLTHTEFILATANGFDKSVHKVSSSRKGPLVGPDVGRCQEIMEGEESKYLIYII